jgi:hypothetical protein
VTGSFRGLPGVQQIKGSVLASRLAFIVCRYRVSWG